jgi:anti-sigma factor RsiW
MTLRFPTHAHDCRQIEALLPPFVDGLGPPATRAAVEAHLERCAACRRAAEAQRAVRALLVSRRAALADIAPDDLADEVRQALATQTPVTQAPPRPAWSRVPAFAAAAAVVIAVTGGFVWATGRSAVLLAAQLTLDHLKCFVIDGDDTLHDLDPEAAAAQFARDRGIEVHLPAAPAETGRGRLVALRQCLYGDGWIAHALYRVDHQPVSMFVIPSGRVPAAQIEAFGRHAEVVVRDATTYVLVAPPGLAEVAAAIGLEAE